MVQLRAWADKAPGTLGANRRGVTAKYRNNLRPGQPLSGPLDVPAVDTNMSRLCFPLCDSFPVPPAAASALRGAVNAESQSLGARALRDCWSGAPSQQDHMKNTQRVKEFYGGEGPPAVTGPYNPSPLNIWLGWGSSCHWDPAASLPLAYWLVAGRGDALSVEVSPAGL